MSPNRLPHPSGWMLRLKVQRLFVSLSPFPLSSSPLILYIPLSFPITLYSVSSTPTLSSATVFSPPKPYHGLLTGSFYFRPIISTLHTTSRNIFKSNKYRTGVAAQWYSTGLACATTQTPQNRTRQSKTNSITLLLSCLKSPCTTMKFSPSSGHHAHPHDCTDPL